LYSETRLKLKSEPKPQKDNVSNVFPLSNFSRVSKQPLDFGSSTPSRTNIYAPVTKTLAELRSKSLNKNQKITVSLPPVAAYTVIDLPNPKK
jgi:hypothetical protein